MTTGPHTECDWCEDTLDGDYHVRRWQISDPSKYGLINPIFAYAIDTLRRLEDGESDSVYLVERPVCDDCGFEMVDSFHPPTANIRDHIPHVLISGLALASGVSSLGNPEIALSSAVLMAILGGVVFLGEIVQMWRQSQTEPADLGDAVQSETQPAKEAYLAGEIGEDELEERLDEELAGEEERDREPKRVMDR